MPEIVVPGVPDLPERPRATDRAHVCLSGTRTSHWIEIPKGTRPECERCKDRLDGYRRVAAGHGTVAEIRQAISALEHVDGQVPLGMTVRIRIEGLVVWACPRSLNMGEEGDPVPLVDVLPNRKARRSKRGRLTRR